MSFHASLRAILDAARSGQTSEPPPPPPPQPDTHHHAADEDHDGDVDAVTVFDVAEHTVAEVKAHVEAVPGVAQAVYDAESARGVDARSSLIDWLAVRLT